MTFAINTIATSPLTMSSREIVSLTGKRHADVMRDIRVLLQELGEDERNFASIYLDAYEREKPCFKLPKDLTITLISGYHVVMRHAITKRWMELEAAKAPALPATYLDALRAHLASEEKRAVLALENAKQAEVIAVAAPKAEFYDELVATSEVYTPTQVANLLGNKLYASAQKVNDLMQGMGWQYKRGRHWVASTLGVSKGYLQSKVFSNEDTGFSGCHVRITVEGLNTLRATA